MLDTWPGLQTTSVQRSKQIMHKCPTFIQTKQECPALQADKSRKAQSSECMDERSRRHAWWLPDTHSHWQALRRKQAGCCSRYLMFCFLSLFFHFLSPHLTSFFGAAFSHFLFLFLFSFFPILLLFPFVLSRSFLTSFLPFSSSSRNFFSHHFFSLSHLLSPPLFFYYFLPPLSNLFLQSYSFLPFSPFIHFFIPPLPSHRSPSPSLSIVTALTLHWTLYLVSVISGPGWLEPANRTTALSPNFIAVLGSIRIFSFFLVFSFFLFFRFFSHSFRFWGGWGPYRSAFDTRV